MRGNVKPTKILLRAGMGISALFVLAGTLFSVPIFATGGFLAWIGIAGHIIADRFGYKDLIRRVFFGFFTLFVGSGVALTITYFVSPIFSQELLLILFLLVSAGLAWFAQDNKPQPHCACTWNWTHALAGFVILGDALILLSFALVRTDAALTSPWQFYGLPFFLFYGFVTFFVLWYAYESEDDSSVWISVLHFFTSFSVVTVIYQIGFGFDPFIHRAAETALAQEGFIEPKQLLYAGQYAFVAGVHQLSALPIALIDKWMTPLAAGLFIPLASFIGLVHGFKLPKRRARLWLHLLLIIPFMSLVFTVPYNTTVVIFLVSLFLLPALKHRRELFTLGLGTMFSVLLHPLLSVPVFALILTGMASTCDKVKKLTPLFRPALVLAVVLALPAMFSVYNLQHGLEPFIFENPFNRIDFFLGLFTDPFRHNYFPIPAVWEAVYSYRTYLPPIALITSIVVSLTVVRKNQFIQLVALYNIAILISLFFVSTLFVFKDIIFYEQSEFALRLLHASYLAAIPALILYLDQILGRHLKKVPVLIPMLVLLSGCITFSFYFSYPQINPKSVTVGPSVSGADVDAVRLINELTDQPHFVLSNQMTSAAALQEQGFNEYLHTTSGNEVLWYAIPTGGELYRYYWAMTFDYPRREVIEEAARFTNTSKGYYLVHHYWPYAAWLAETARQTADNYYEIRGGEVIIFEYNVTYE